jgi:hypothetical protein
LSVSFGAEAGLPQDRRRRLSRLQNEIFRAALCHRSTGPINAGMVNAQSAMPITDFVDKVYLPEFVKSSSGRQAKSSTKTFGKTI